MQQALTQEQVAFAAGLTRAHFALIETGSSSSRKPGTFANPQIATIASIAAVLDVPMTALYPFDAESRREAVDAAALVLGGRRRNSHHRHLDHPDERPVRRR